MRMSGTEYCGGQLSSNTAHPVPCVTSPMFVATGPKKKKDYLIFNQLGQHKSTCTWWERC